MGKLRLRRQQLEKLGVEARVRISPLLQKCCLCLSGNKSFFQAESDLVLLTGMKVGHSTLQRQVQTSIEHLDFPDTEIKQAGMATTSAIAEANGETLERVGQTKQQSERILEKLTALGLNLEANEQRSDKSKQAFVDWVGRTIKELNQIALELRSSRSAIERLQQKTFWLKWADWFSPLLALTIVGGASFLAGGWLTYQKYNGYVEELGRDIMNWNLDRIVKCRQDNNPKCTFWIVPPEQRE